MRSGFRMAGRRGSSIGMTYIPGRRLRPEQMDGKQAAQEAKAFAQIARDKAVKA
jgi:hypothetical protein